MATAWFIHDGGANTDPQNYTSVGGTVPPQCVTTFQRLCAIFAEVQFIDEEEKPIITSALQAEINLAVLNLQQSANVRLRPN